LKHNIFPKEYTSTFIQVYMQDWQLNEKYGVEVYNLTHDQ